MWRCKQFMAHGVGVGVGAGAEGREDNTGKVYEISA